MRKIIIALLFTAAAAGQDDPLKTLRRQHPRLVTLDSDIDRAEMLIRTNPQARKIHGQLVKEARKIANDSPVEYKVAPGDPPRLLAVARKCLDRVTIAAALYRLDGNTEYRDLALRELRAAAAFPDWNPIHHLDIAELTTAFAIGYDWLYPSLSADEKRWMKKAILEKAIARTLPYYDHERWRERVPMSWNWAEANHNWNLVCNAGATLGALALADEEPELAREVLRNMQETVKLPMAEWAPAGAWKEGPGYWHYATTYTAYLLSGLDTALGTDFGISSADGFDQTGRYRIYSSGPIGKTFNFSDNADRVGGAAEMFWLARRFHQPVYAWHQRYMLETGVRPHALDLLWFDPEGKSPQDSGWPSAAYFPGTEVAFFRSSWDDADGIFVGVKGGDNGFNHSHADLGSFVLDAGGVRWALDLGPDNYNMPDYFSRGTSLYYRLKAESHNTLLIGSDNQKLKVQAPIIAHGFEPQFSYVRLNLSPAYPKAARVERGVALIAKRHIIIQDEIVAAEPVDVLWGMVTDAEVHCDKGLAELKKTGWKLSARILTPADAIFDAVSTAAPPPQNPNKGTCKLVVRPSTKTTNLRLVVLLTPHRDQEPASQLDWKVRPLAGW